MGAFQAAPRRWHFAACLILSAGLTAGLPAGLSAGRVPADEALTFFAFSDIHFGQSSPYKDGNRNSMAGWLNTLPGKAYPDWVGGGPVGQPRGVLIAGDFIDYPDTALWARYVADYGIKGEGRLRFPAYDAMGNHEFYGPSFDRIRAAFRRRNEARMDDTALGVAGLDTLGLHYSWDWNGIHFVNLNVYGGEPRVFQSGVPNSFGSINFLRKDLAERVGSSGRPVLVMQHYNFSFRDGWMPNSDRANLAALLKQYNCIGILHGHTHERRFYAYDGLDIFDDGTAMNGDHLVFRILDGKMLVLNRVGNEWGSLRFEKAISMSGPWKKETVPEPKPGPGPDTAAIAPKGFRLNVAGMGTVYRGTAEIRKVEIWNHEGRLVRTLEPSGGSFTWDRRDGDGRPARRGLYLACAPSSGKSRATVLAKIPL